MRIIKQIGLYALAILIQKLLGLMLLPISTRFLSQSEFGLLNFLNTTAAAFSLILCFGVPELIFRHYKASNRGVFRDGLIISFCLIFTFLILGTLFSHEIAQTLPADLNAGHIKLLCISLSLSSLLVAPLAYYRVTEQALKFCYINISLGVSQTLMSVAALYFGFGVEGMLIASIFASALTCLLCSRTYFLAFISFNKEKWSISGTRFRFMCSLLLSGGLAYFTNGIENWFIVAELGEASLAEYFIAVQFALVTSFAYEPVRNWWFARRFKFFEESPKEYASLCLKSLNVGVTVCLFMWVLGPLVIDIILPTSYMNSGYYLKWLLLITILKHHSDMMNIGCYIYRSAMYVPLINGSAGVLACLLLWKLVKVYHIEGALIALIVTQVWRLTLFFSFSQFFAPVQFDYYKLLPCWAALIGLILTDYLELLNSVIGFVQFVSLAVFIFWLALLYKKDVLINISRIKERFNHG